MERRINIPDDVKHPRYLVWIDRRTFWFHDTLVDALDRRRETGGTVYEPLAMAAAERVVAESDELATLRARVAALTEGLRPFAYDNFASRCEDDEVAWGGPMVTVGDCRRAAALVKEEAK